MTVQAIPGIHVRGAAELEPAERARLAQAGLAQRAKVEAWACEGSNRQNGYATHGIYRYFGKFPPSLAARLIARYSRPGDWVLDPMVGSGTTAVEALLAGRHCVARDVSPLSVLLTRVKTTPVAPGAAEEGVRRVEAAYRSRPARGASGPVGLRNAGHWFLPATVRSLRRLRAALDAEPAGEVIDLLRVAFAATIRRVSRATTLQGRLFLDAETALPDAWPTFAQRCRTACERVAALPRLAGVHTVVEQHSVLQPAAIPVPQAPRLIIAHPPYFNNYRYSSINSLELAWLGFEHGVVRREEIRESFKVGKPERVGPYVDDLARALGFLAAELAPRGVLALMIGDTVLRGEYVPTTAMLLERMAGLPLRLEQVALRVPRYAEASWCASQRRTGQQVGTPLCDFVLVFRGTGKGGRR